MTHPNPIPLESAADVRPAGTVTEAVRGNASEARPWLASAPVVEALGAAGIAHAGVLTTRYPCRIVRDSLAGACPVASWMGAAVRA